MFRAPFAEILMYFFISQGFSFDLLSLRVLVVTDEAVLGVEVANVPSSKEQKTKRDKA